MEKNKQELQVSNTSKLILSICIPSYNRFEKLKMNLESILKAKSMDFEIIIVDNISPHPIEKYITIVDKRLRIIKRKKPVDGKYNIGNCFSYAKGLYTMLCLDKDFIQGDYLDKFLQELRQNSYLAGGYCIQNKFKRNGSSFITKENAILNYGYLSKHPSGNFYKTEILLGVIKKLKLSERANTFSLDIYMAECAVKGAMMFYDKPLIYLEKSKDTIKVKSYSYKKEDNSIFFFPQNRVNQFRIYVRHLNTLSISKIMYMKILCRLYCDTLRYVTVGFQSLMKDKAVCTHYRLKCRDVTVNEMKENRRLLNQSFKKIYKSIFVRYIICIYGGFKLIKGLLI